MGHVQKFSTNNVIIFVDQLQVAIKCLGNEKMTSNSTEFLKEAAVMHSIEHPNIVRLYGVVLHLDSLMLVSKFLPQWLKVFLRFICSSDLFQRVRLLFTIIDDFIQISIT